MKLSISYGSAIFQTIREVSMHLAQKSLHAISVWVHILLRSIILRRRNIRSYKCVNVILTSGPITQRIYQISIKLFRSAY